MRLVIKNSIQLCLRTLVFSTATVLRHLGHTVQFNDREKGWVNKILSE